MKALLVLVLLSTSYQANAAVDLSCSSKVFPSQETKILTQEMGKYRLEKVGPDHRVLERTSLYLKGSDIANNGVIHTGSAVTQVQVDAFSESNFELFISYEKDKALLTLKNADGVEMELIPFKCHSIDNR